VRTARLFTVAAAAAVLVVSTLSGGLPAGAIASGPEVADGDLPFVAKVDFGEQHRSCTGVLVATRWIVTAKSCFADGTGEVVAGVPSRPVNVVLGRTDLTKATGHRLAVTSLIPHPERNIVLAELSSAVTNITPMSLDGGAPQEGESLRIAGYGRTGTEWIPERLHAGTFTVGAVAASGFAVTGSDGATICKGDAGGPAFRETGSSVQLVGINDTSSQKGCFGESESQDGATEARTDDLAGWIRSSIAVAPDALREPVTGEFNRDGIQDLIAADTYGKLWLYPGTTSGTRWGARTEIGTGWSGYREFVVGKINRDAYDDLVTINTASGDLWMYPGTAAGNRFGTRVQIGNGWSTDFRDLAIGKVNRDAYDDLLVVKSSTQQLLLYKGNATGGNFDAGVQYGTGWACCKQLNVGRFTDDDYDDLLTVESATGKMRIYAGTAAGTQFAAGVDAGAGTAWNASSYIAKARVDDTGIEGLLGVDSSTGRTWLYPRTAAGGWAPRFSPAGRPYAPQPSDLANVITGKFNRDGFTDVIGVDSAGVAWMHPGTAANTFSPRVQVATGWSGLREFGVGRINRDVYDDVVAIETSTNVLWLYPGTAAEGTFGARVQIGSGWNTEFRDLVIGKVNRDAYDDLLVVKSSTQQLLLYKGNATGGNFDAGVQYGTGWSCCKELALGRFTDDDYDDLLTVESATGKMRIYAGTAAGTQFAAGVDAGAGSDWLNRSALIPFTLGADTRTSLLAKESTGALVRYPVDNGRSVNWTDPIRFGSGG
jgi:hypothetical protein